MERPIVNEGTGSLTSTFEMRTSPVPPPVLRVTRWFSSEDGLIAWDNLTMQLRRRCLGRKWKLYWTL